jgi:GNAT superfamily N-acetyltransferase
MRVVLEQAREADAAGIAALRTAVARQLTTEYGRGTWTFAADSEWSARADILTSHVYVFRHHGTIGATLRLSTKAPWLGAIDFFTPSRTPLYLTSMAVSPKLQRQGIGRLCLEQVKRIARAWPADALRLDAYDADAGAGEFYEKCGFRIVRRAPYNGTPLIYFEYLLAGPGVEPASQRGAAAPDQVSQTR